MKKINDSNLSQLDQEIFSAARLKNAKNRKNI